MSDEFGGKDSSFAGLRDRHVSDRHGYHAIHAWRVIAWRDA